MNNLTTIVYQNNVSCYGYSDSSAQINIISGVPPYQYMWSNGQTLNHDYQSFFW